ncbi:hypothetical protein DL239_18970 [Sedimentitalea sp. CY04]|uniref:Uncharacterized protein n=1 Tax=Parasedimentitalea denitrificans TaxID=2211118 RepID=A0ABX0WBQ2_9RHOB|nr:hypothetical protein [Sedimentitalea sp. CY04]
MKGTVELVVHFETQISGENPEYRHQTGQLTVKSCSRNQDFVIEYNALSSFGALLAFGSEVLEALWKYLTLSLG